MNRLRLTASAVAATSLSTLGLAGIGAAAAHAGTVTPGTGYSGKGFDTCAAPPDAQMDDWYANSPYHAVGVYIGGSSYLCKTQASPSGGYTPQWVQHQSAAGWAMWALYSGQQAATLAVPGADPTKLGAADAIDAAHQATLLGFAPGSTIFVDVEHYAQAASTPLVVAYLKSFAAGLVGFKAGLYGGSDAAGTPSAIGDAAADPTLQTALAAVDVANWTGEQENFHPTTNDPNVPSSLWAKHQRIHQYFADVTKQYGTTPPLKFDADWVDLAPAAMPGTVSRIAGPNRIGTAVTTSQTLWPAAAAAGQQWQGKPGAQAAVLSRDDNFADALGGSALAAHFGGPLLLTPTVRLDRATAAELVRALAPGATVYILGGEKALSPTVLDDVVALGFVPVRIGGVDRYDTAVRIAQTMAADMRDAKGQPSVQRVLLATALNYPDALAAGTAAGATPDTILLLTADKAMPAATAGYLAQISGQAAGPQSATVFPIGGAANAAAAAAPVPASNLRLNLLVGADRYQTAALVAHQFFSATGAPHTVGIAVGTNWPDSLSGGAAMGTLGGPLLLTRQGTLDPATQGYLDEVLPTGAVDAADVFGGTAAVGDGVIATLRSEIH